MDLLHMFVHIEIRVERKLHQHFVIGSLEIPNTDFTENNIKVSHFLHLTINRSKKPFVPELPHADQISIVFFYSHCFDARNRSLDQEALNFDRVGS